MSHIWTFSPSSEVQLQKCIAASLPPDEHNKWVQKFGRKIDENDSKQNIDVKVSADLDIKEESSKIDSQGNYAELIEMIENECIDDLVEECCKNNNLFPHLAQSLSTPSIEKICKQVLNYRNKPEHFLTNFYTIFVPIAIKREYCRYILDFLIQSRENNEKDLNMLLDILIRDLEIPRNVLYEYILILNKNEQGEFMKKLLHTDITAESFVNNLSIVYAVYINCPHSHELQSIVFANLIQNADHCKSDRQYGRLLLAFLQTEKSMDGKLNKKNIREIIEKHRSPFRRPCEILLNEIMQNAE